jgi:hypothetical protein
MSDPRQLFTIIEPHSIPRRRLAIVARHLRLRRIRAFLFSLSYTGDKGGLRYAPPCRVGSCLLPLLEGVAV